MKGLFQRVSVDEVNKNKTQNKNNNDTTEGCWCPHSNCTLTLFTSDMGAYLMMAHCDGKGKCTRSTN